jgi:5-methylcytosine-specific restriction endonuclease McrA
MPKKQQLTKEEKRIKERCSKLRSMMRRAWSRDPERYAVLNDAKRTYKGPNKRQKVEYKCALCKNYFKSTDISVDHITAVGPFTIDSFGEWVKKLFCWKEGLQALCSTCHTQKSSEENNERRSRK